MEQLTIAGHREGHVINECVSVGTLLLFLSNPRFLSKQQVVGASLAGAGKQKYHHS
jgi:hypothetical protein